MTKAISMRQEMNGIENMQINNIQMCNCFNSGITTTNHALMNSGFGWISTLQEDELKIAIIVQR